MASKDEGSLEARLAGLEAQVHRLEEDLAVTREALDAAREALDAAPLASRPKGQTMRALLECPHCSGRSLLHVRRVLDRGDANAEHQFSVTTKGFWSPKPIGRFSCWVCEGCGYAEWYVRDPETLEVDQDAIERVGIRTDDQGPYR